MTGSGVGARRLSGRDRALANFGVGLLGALGAATNACYWSLTFASMDEGKNPMAQTGSGLMGAFLLLFLLQFAVIGVLAARSPDIVRPLRWIMGGIAGLSTAAFLVIPFVD